MSLSDFFKKKSSVKAFPLVLGAAVIIGLVSLAAVAADVQNSEFCGKCHVIKPYYYSWENSPHSNVDCLSCHVEKGTGLVSIHARGLQNLYTNIFRDNQLPIKSSRKISDQTCLNCHSLNRVITPSGDLTIPHTEHLAYNTGCVDCHPGVAHASVSSKEVFNEQTIASIQSFSYDAFAMNKTGCLECHNGKRATASCSACHTDTNIPGNHSLPDFSYAHGPYVKEDIADCMRCHVGFGKDRSWEGSTIPEVTRNAAFCRECHEGSRPDTHTAFWSVGHKIRGKAQPAGCLVCHDWNTPAPPMNAANIITCASCHDQTPAGHDQPRWYYDHKITVGDKGSSSCFDCHGATSCSSCHTRENVGF
jgi:nitrate/TMAO reductase-like tetraheme cytochrome c subunit